MSFSKVDCANFVKQAFYNSAVPSLIKYIQIENLSRGFDVNYKTNGKLEEAAHHIMNWIKSLGIQGLHTEIIQHEGYTPIIFTQIKGDLDLDIFYYGHFDKQPPFTGWFEGFGPNTPVIKDGKLYGRGGADDGYSTYSTMLSIKACQLQGIKIPRCVMITQGDQETGGHIEYYIEVLKQRIGNPETIFCLDSGTIDYKTLTITSSLRGYVSGILTVEVLQNGVHSGTASGVIPSSFRIIRKLIDRIQNGETGELAQQFQVDIPKDKYEQIALLAKEKKLQAIGSFPLVGQTQMVSSDPLTLLINKGWKAQLQVIGASNFPPTETAGNVLRPKSTLKLSIRLPPTKNAEQAKEAFIKYLTTDVPYGAKVTLDKVIISNGWNAPVLKDYLNQALDEAALTYYQTQRMNQPEGFSIPLMGLLSSIWPNAQYLITGVLGPDSNAHGPNEFLHLEYTQKLTCCMAHVLAKTSEFYSK